MTNKSGSFWNYYTKYREGINFTDFEVSIIFFVMGTILPILVNLSCKISFLGCQELYVPFHHGLIVGFILAIVSLLFSFIIWYGKKQGVFK